VSIGTDGATGAGTIFAETLVDESTLETAGSSVASITFVEATDFGDLSMTIADEALTAGVFEVHVLLGDPT
jgi:hypothetical protein